MLTSPEQFIEAQKKQVTALVGLGQKSFANIEKAVELNMNMAKGMLDESAEVMNTMLSVKDMQELVAVSSTAGQP
ncbi:MAG: phasin family protein, partial [Limnobacter sp.]|nr:phasin family protein [Limnobacter sp.]